MSKQPRGPLHARWRMDVDYWDKLSAGERDYLAKFLADYYNSNRLGYGPLDAAQRDLVTITDEQARELLKPSQRAYYTPEDYMEPAYAVSPHSR